MIDWHHPHRRFNPLSGRWVLVSPQRASRPWQGQLETVASEPLPPYDPACYLCPGNVRAGGVRNPEYASTFVFDNDFPALFPNIPQDTPHDASSPSPLLRAEPEPGVCRVICFSPRHDLTLARMPLDAAAGVVETWADQYRELSALPFIGHVQIFENRGAMMGASNPHPHCQIWATASVPDEVAVESANQAAYAREHASCLLCDYLALEKNSERLVCENSSFAALVPFWAVWPFEVLIASKTHTNSLSAFPQDFYKSFADILQQIVQRYDALFDAPFPYTFGLHQSAEESFHFHAHFLPPLLRSATVRKFMVGFELLAQPQRDLTPEQAAAMMKCAVKH